MDNILNTYKTFFDNNDEHTISIIHRWSSGLGEGLSVTYGYMRIAEFIKNNFSKKYKIRYYIADCSKKLNNSSGVLEYMFDKNNILRYFDDFTIVPNEHKNNITKIFQFPDINNQASPEIPLSENEAKEELYNQYISLQQLLIKHEKYEGILHRNAQTSGWDTCIFFKTHDDYIDDEKLAFNKFIREEISEHPILRGWNNRPGIGTYLPLDKIINPEIYGIAINFCQKNNLQLYNFDSFFQKIRKWDTYTYDHFDGQEIPKEQYYDTYLGNISDFFISQMNENTNYFISSDSDLLKEKICKKTKKCVALYKGKYGLLKSSESFKHTEDIVSMLPPNIVESGDAGIREIIALVEMIIICFSRYVIHPFDDLYSLLSLFLWYPSVIHGVPILHWGRASTGENFYENYVSDDPEKRKLAIREDLEESYNWQLIIQDQFGRREKDRYSDRLK